MMDQPDASNDLLAARRAATDVIGFTDLHREMVSWRSHAKAIEYQAQAAAACVRLGKAAETLLPLIRDAMAEQTATIGQIHEMHARVEMLSVCESCLSFHEATGDSDEPMPESARAFHHESILAHGSKLAQLLVSLGNPMENGDE